MEFANDLIEALLKGIVPHGTDLIYLFGVPLREDFTVCVSTNRTANDLCVNPAPLFNDRDANMSQTMITMWTNFAKYGNPTPEPLEGVIWKKFDLEEKHYLVLDWPSRLETSFGQRMSQFWNEYLLELNANTNYIVNPTSSAALNVEAMVEIMKSNLGEDMSADDQWLIVWVLVGTVGFLAAVCVALAITLIAKIKKTP
ncbi:PREDICTED: acetylcholinesterase-like [Priapulus caudatus]|uniref:Acetylcholinesterase-like n=1 Tax=Priapulus caudatus TaxID=37621 RepID=A0ABM1DN89_PRICU|nr:PREDICTED: acetylcholinesterase-like [Priapulus caudatus]